MIILRVDHVPFIRLSTKCFHILAAVNTVRIPCVCISVSSPMFESFFLGGGVYLGMELLDHIIILFLNFGELPYYFYTVACLRFYKWTVPESLIP